jgi:hypothetical protein
MDPHKLSCREWAAMLLRYCGSEYADRSPPSAPTAARAGSEAKIQVMADRFERGEHLHHPDDVQADGLLGVASTMSVMNRNGRHEFGTLARDQSGIGILVKPEKEKAHALACGSSV